MPLYEFICQDCGERFDKLLRMSDDPKTVTCPSCTSKAVERAISTFATSGGATLGGGSATSSNCGPVG